jgi:hypothetical protein
MPDIAIFEKGMFALKKVGITYLELIALYWSQAQGKAVLLKHLSTVLIILY